MSTIPLWIRIPVVLICGAIIAYEAYQLYLQAVGSITGAIAVAMLLAAWLGAWLFFKRIKMDGQGGQNSN